MVAVRIDFTPFETPRDVPCFGYGSGEAFEMQSVTNDTELLLTRGYVWRLFHEYVSGSFDFRKTGNNRFAKVPTGRFIRNGYFQFLLRSENAWLVVQL